MSNIFITDIVGSIGIPSNDTQLASATSTFDGILSGVANLTYDRVLGWVEDQAGPDGAEGVRTLNCMVEKFTYLTQECPSETQVDTLGAAIEAALEADASITTIGEQQYHLFQTGAYFLWQRDAAGGFLYPATTTDDVAVGGHVSPAGKWFDDGDLVLGTDAMVGAERLRVVGGGRIEKSSSDAIPALFVQAFGSHPAAQQAALLDVDVNSIALDIDTEATSKPLINLQPLNANTRGDIAFGVTRTADPASPIEGDLWYNSTDNYYRYYDGAANRTIATTSEIYWNRDGAGFIYAKTATDDLYIGGSTPNGVWFDDGDLVVGGSSMTGTERLKVVGSVLVDQDSDAYGIDIDSEATDNPLINLQPIVTNDRGDIAFGTARTSDPANPDEGDVWYNSTNKCLSYWDGTYRRCLNSPGLLAGANQGYYDGNNDYARISGTGWKVYGSCYFPGTNISTPQLFRIIMSRAGTTGSIDVRLYDFTNALEIARVTVSASGKATYTDTTLANLPAAGAIFEVQAQKSAGGASNGYLHYWEFY